MELMDNLAMIAGSKLKVYVFLNEFLGEL